MLRYRINILDELNRRGYNSVKLRKDKILSESTTQKIRNNDTSLTLENINRICVILKCQISDILEVIPTDDEKIKYY